jgi:hypothetical protein
MVDCTLALDCKGGHNFTCNGEDNQSGVNYALQEACLCHIAGSTVINSKNPCRNNLEIIDLKS